MRKILLAAMAAMVMFASCDKNDGISTEGDNVLVVRLPGSELRSVQDQLPDNQSTATISNVEVFLINASSGAVVDRESFTPAEITAKSKRIEEVSSSVNKVVVVANIPSGVLSAVQGLTNYNAITKYDGYTVANQNQGGEGIDYLTMMGEATPAPATDPSPDGHTYKEVTIALNALTARFEVGTVKPGVGVESVELLGVWINSYYKDGSKVAPVDAATGFNNNSSPYWVTSPSASTSPSITSFGTVNLTTPYVPAEYYDAYNSSVTLNASSKVYAYHVFAGANIPHLILLVKGEYKDGFYADGKKYFLGWLTFVNYISGVDKITSVDANKIYRIGVGTTGIEVNAKDITVEPELGKFDLGVKVTITPWTRENVTPSVD